jgi:hypothetical protein
MLSKALGVGVWFHRAPVMGNMVGPSREGWGFFYQKNFYWGIRETCKRRLWKRATISIGAPTGEHGGGWFNGTFFLRQMKEGSGNGASQIKLIWALLFKSRLCWEPELAENLNFCEGLRFSWLGIRIWEQKGPVLRPRFIGTERAQHKVTV